MLLVRRNNDFDWLNNWFDDNFFNTPVMAQTTTTAPAVNVKEDNKQYVMEVAVPGLKKEQVNMSIDKDGILPSLSRTRMSRRTRTRRNTICAASSLTPAIVRVTLCQTM